MSYVLSLQFVYVYNVTSLRFRMKFCDLVITVCFIQSKCIQPTASPRDYVLFTCILNGYVSA